WIKTTQADVAPRSKHDIEGNIRHLPGDSDTLLQKFLRLSAATRRTDDPRARWGQTAQRAHGITLWANLGRNETGIHDLGSGERRELILRCNIHNAWVASHKDPIVRLA